MTSLAAQGHAGIVSQELWHRLHAVLQESPRVRAGRSRGQAASLLRGLLFGADGRALSPTHTRKKGRLYRYCVSQVVLQGGANDATYRRLPAAALRQAFLQPDQDSACQTWRHVADQLRPRWPKLGALMDESEHDVTAYMAFPAVRNSRPEINAAFIFPGDT